MHMCKLYRLQPQPEQAGKDSADRETLKGSSGDSGITHLRVQFSAAALLGLLFQLLLQVLSLL